MKRNFRVGVRYTFEGAYTVRAVSDKEAARLVLRQCGLTCGNIHTTLDELTCPDWDFPTHPDTRIGNVEPIEIEESETHYETIREIAPSENEGRATVRIHSVDDDNYRIIADNGPTSETNETLN